MKAIFFDVQPYEENFLKENTPKELEAVFLKDSLNPSFEVGEDLKDAQIISVFTSSTLNDKVLEKFPNLKFVITRSVGYSHINTNYCKERGINIFNAPHYGDHTVAEYVFGILLDTIRNIGQGAHGVKNDSIKMAKYTGVELFGKTMGVVGVGAIGANVLDIAHGFKMNTLAYDPHPKGEYKYVELDELLRKSDIISINSPLNEKTCHLINKENIEKMKDGVIIVNAARGEIIDTQALYEALISGKIAYAALDVIECEEILCSEDKKCVGLDNIKEICLEKFFLNQKLMQLPNVTITPHMAYNTKEAIDRILTMTKENLNSCLNFDSGAKNLVLI